MKRFGITLGFALLLIATLVLTHPWWPGVQRGLSIRFDLPKDCEVSIGIRDDTGKLIHQLAISEPMKRGKHVISWDGKDYTGTAVEPGSYRWIGVTHDPFEAQIRGWAGLNGTPLWPPDGRGNDWGQDGGAPSAVAADQSRVYLGWSGGGVVACRLDGGVNWSESLAYHRRVQVIAVDGSTGYVLSRDAQGEDALVKFDVDRGSLHWGSPNGPQRRFYEGLRILDLWSADAATRPTQADAMAARAGRIYLSFTAAQFIAVLDAETGAYLQTIVGGSPEYIDVTATKTEIQPGSLAPADFAILSLRGGGLAKVLLAHDPLWVITSTFEPLDAAERITALSIIGDAAPMHPHSVFLGLGIPFSQVQRREILSSEGYVWSAGLAGGRPDRGPWEARTLAPVRAMALDARGRLWVAEGDTAPPRFSVWSTDGNEGRLEHEYFGPISKDDVGAAVLPSDPEIVVGAGCEWRIDPRGSPAKCLGVITHDDMAAAEFLTGPSGETLLQVHHHSGDTSVFERRGEGDYVLREQQPAQKEGGIILDSKKLTINPAGMEVVVLDTEHTWIILTPDEFVIGSIFGPPSGMYIGPPERDTAPVASLVQTADGRYYAAAGHHAVIRFEITGLSSTRELSGGMLVVPMAK